MFTNWTLTTWGTTLYHATHLFQILAPRSRPPGRSKTTAPTSGPPQTPQSPRHEMKSSSAPPSALTRSGVRTSIRSRPRYTPRTVKQLVGGPGPPLWKIWTSIGMIIPNIWENKIDGNQTTNQTNIEKKVQIWLLNLLLCVFFAGNGFPHDIMNLIAW